MSDRVGRPSSGWRNIWLNSLNSLNLWLNSLSHTHAHTHISRKVGGLWRIRRALLATLFWTSPTTSETTGLERGTPRPAPMSIVKHSCLSAFSDVSSSSPKLRPRSCRGQHTKDSLSREGGEVVRFYQRCLLSHRCSINAH